MGFLDNFDDPNFISSLLGGSPGGGYMPQPDQQPPQGGGIGSDYASTANNAPPPGGSPNGGYGVPGVDALTPAAAGNAPPSDYPAPTGVPLPRPRPDMSAPMAAPAPGGIGSDANAPLTFSYGGQHVPIIGNPADATRPPSLDANGGGAIPPNAAPAQFQPPGNNAAPPLPPQSVFNGPPVTNAGGGLAGQLGLNPDRVRAGMAGVGRGLSAVGKQPLGTTKGAAFAAGAGGSLEGTAAAQEQQKKELFDQSSTAFKDMLAAKNSDNTADYRAAQSKYLMARAQSLMTGGTANGSRAWQNTDYGKTIQVENEAQKYEKGQQIILQKRWGLNQASPEQQQQDLDKLNKDVEAYRTRLYKQTGIDPGKAERLKDMGIAASNPFDTKGMTIDQFHQMVPMGAWFKDQNGVVRQRTVPPPGQGGDGGQQQSSNPAAPGPAANYDDLSAMSSDAAAA